MVYYYFWDEDWSSSSKPQSMLLVMNESNVTNKWWQNMIYIATCHVRKPLSNTKPSQKIAISIDKE
jgi:hypothetical protein